MYNEPQYLINQHGIHMATCISTDQMITANLEIDMEFKRIIAFLLPIIPFISNTRTEKSSSLRKKSGLGDTHEGHEKHTHLHM